MNKSNLCGIINMIHILNANAKSNDLPVKFSSFFIKAAFHTAFAAFSELIKVLLRIFI